MHIKTLLLAAVICCCFIQTQAQTLGKQYFVVDLKIDGQLIKTYQKGHCGFDGPMQWGFYGPLPDIEFQAVWAYDVTPDSLCCDSILPGLSGKIAVMRRGLCEYARKALWAQIAGAEAAVIVNGFASTHGDDCEVPNLNNAVDGVIDIKTIACSRLMGEDIANTLDTSTELVTLRFRRVALFNPTAEYSFMTPAAQRVPVDFLGVHVANNAETAQYLRGKIEITDPAGTTTVIYSDSVNVAPFENTRITFPAYLPTSDLEGMYTVMYTATSGGIQQKDTLYRQFMTTADTWGTDNGEMNGSAPMNTSIYYHSELLHITGSLVKTGNMPSKIESVTFGIGNAAMVADTIDPSNNIVQVLLLDADSNVDGVNEIGDGPYAFDGMELVSYADVAFDENTSSNLQTVFLTPVVDSNTLKANHLYYLVLKHDGSMTNRTELISFRATDKVQYGNFNGSHTPNQAYYNPDGWSGRTVILRLHEFLGLNSSVKSPQLDASKFTVSPNPTADWAYFDLQLERENPFVRVEVLDRQGRTLLHQSRKQFQAGRIAFDLSQLPAGLYYVHAYTAQEGSAMVRVVKR